MKLSEAAAKIMANGGKAPRGIQRVSIAGKPIWTRDDRAEFGHAGRTGYLVGDTRYARAADIVRAAKEA